MKRVLVLAYYFPPLGGIGSLRTLKFCQYLPESGWEATVVAPRNGAYFRDPSLSFPEDKVVRTASLELSRAAKRAVGSSAGDTQPLKTGQLLGGFRRLARRWLYRPDAQVGWYPFALGAARQLLRERRFDAVFSSSFPITAHLVARRLCQQTGLPWVAEFRDPWTDRLAYDSSLRRRLDEALERALLAEATQVVTASPRWAELFANKGARRVCVITNGYDPVDFPTAAVPRPDAVTYVGSFYPEEQDLATPLRALGALLRTGHLPSLLLKFVGELPAGARKLASEVGLEGRVVSTGFVSHRESLRHVAESDVLLLLGSVPRTAGPSILAGVIPGKAFEYLGSGRPLLQIGPSDSDLARLLAPMPGVRCVSPGDVDGARAGILALSGAPTAERTRLLEAFTRRSLAARLAQVLDAATAS